MLIDPAQTYLQILSGQHFITMTLNCEKVSSATIFTIDNVVVSHFSELLCIYGIISFQHFLCNVSFKRSFLGGGGRGRAEGERFVLQITLTDIY